jgi:hypothetical protein
MKTLLIFNTEWTGSRLSVTACGRDDPPADTCFHDQRRADGVWQNGIPRNPVGTQSSG